MGDNSSHFKDYNLPVENVSWYMAQVFIDAINHLQLALTLCLPSEAQWEYACRAGTQTPFSFGEQIDSSLVNFDGNYPYNNGKKSEDRNQTVAVKSLPANAWGLYEMHGNVWEWCQDGYGECPTASVTDPQGSEKGDDRVLRGGSWLYDGRYCRSADRNYYSPVNAYYDFGFRLARGH